MEGLNEQDWIELGGTVLNLHVQHYTCYCMATVRFVFSHPTYKALHRLDKLYGVLRCRLDACIGNAFNPATTLGDGTPLTRVFYGANLVNPNVERIRPKPNEFVGNERTIVSTFIHDMRALLRRLEDLNFCDENRLLIRKIAKQLNAIEL